MNKYLNFPTAAMVRLKRVLGVLCLVSLLLTLWVFMVVPNQSKLGLRKTSNLEIKLANSHNDTGKVTKFMGYSNRNITLSKRLRDVIKLIQEIWERNEYRSAELDPNPLRNVSCRRGFTKYHKVEDLLCMTPPTFDTGYKNPCWIDGAGEFQCLPYFQVIGMDKSGSTDLFDRLAKHPQVLCNNGTLHKETMWWSWLRYGHWLKTGAELKDFKDYLKFFAGAAMQIKANQSDNLITGDGTPMDMWDQSGWIYIPQNRGRKEPQYITPHLIKHINPNVKLIVILRDPIERLFSDYFFLGLGKMTSLAFHDSVLESVRLLHTCTRHKFLRTCLYERKLHKDITARIHLGFYPIFIKDWLRVFPKEQFLILRSEDFSSNIGDHLKQAFQFLNLKSLSEDEMKSIVGLSRKYVTKRKKRAGDMKPETRVILEALYSPSNKELSHLLNDPSYLWT